eukprot:COSAG05_NODE_2488_length_2998_cov_7.858896_1_plen_69_part_00
MPCYHYQHRNFVDHNYPACQARRGLLATRTLKVQRLRAAARYISGDLPPSPRGTQISHHTLLHTSTGK